MRVTRLKNHGVRVFSDSHDEIAYAGVGLRGLKLEVEFPSEWHDHRRAWFRCSVGLAWFAFSFPWPKAYKDHMQCAGPTYGFSFHEDLLFLRYGNDTGHSKDRHKTHRAFYMPWAWNHVRHTVDETTRQTADYTYTLESGEVQHRTATIVADEREWRRAFWWPRKMVRRSIDVTFNDEVGERTGSWKGGTIGCGYELLPNETPLACLRRMERERKF